MSRTGLLLINLGTPQAPVTSAVRKYLKQFLSDPRVLDINALGRFFLLRLIILPFRSPKSAEAYQKIWTDRGSPLLFESQDLAAKVRATLSSEDFVVELGMRYGEPSIESSLRKLQQADVSRVLVLPLYPQYSSASTGSSLEEVFRVASMLWNVPPLRIGEPFYEHPAFIDAFAEVASPVLKQLQPDHVLFSYHGLPERHVKKSDLTGQHCLQSSGCCDRMTTANANCYRAQCFATTRALSKKLELTDTNHSVSFQSRLGRDPWVKPYTDEVLPELAKKGVKKIAVLCPAFVADCLETLEEVRLRGKEDFVKAGGEELVLIPSLNSHPAWVRAVVAMTKELL
jgi:protoporphyrin/coproporphyrin ferrochelatase